MIPEPNSSAAMLLKGSPWEGKDLTELPWYSAEIDQIEPQAQELFEKYCGIPTGDVKRDKAYFVHPYPCLARWAFLELSVSHSSHYSEVLERVKNGEKYLDLGCCVGQDIRKLVFDGAPSENTYGSDLEMTFMNIGYELFRDKSTLKTTFIAADVFDQDSNLKQLNGNIDIVHAASFLHLFSLEDQIIACKRIVQLMKNKPGSFMIGRQIGNLEPGDQEGSLTKDRKRYRHNVESFARMWTQVGEETGTKWQGDARLEDTDLFAMEARSGGRFIPPGSKWLSFGVRRVA